MTSDKNASCRFYQVANYFLLLLGTFNIGLTLYVCTQYYAYLPTSDVWAHIDFLVQSAQGNLNTAYLFEKHNGVHLIALPKLVYFFDMWLAQGSGKITVITSLLALLAAGGFFVAAIFKTEQLNRKENFFWSLISLVFILSACQVESLLNPANLQWSLLVFSGAWTAWFLDKYEKDKNKLSLLGLCVGAVLISLTSASPLFALLPLVLVAIRKKRMKIVSLRNISIFIGIILIVFIGISLVVGSFLLSYSSELVISSYTTSLIMAIKFILDFIAPPIERLHFLPFSLIAGAFVLYGFIRLYKNRTTDKEDTVFFSFLLLFSGAVILASAITRGFSPSGFTFRFVNIGLLFSLSFFVVVLIASLQNIKFKKLLLLLVLVYSSLLSYINLTEASHFGYGRNHIRLNQVAYALGMRDPYVVVSMPGFSWQEEEYAFVQANKNKLKKMDLGIYSDDAYKNIDKPIKSVLDKKIIVDCNQQTIKNRRLMPDSAEYKLIGQSTDLQGKRLSQAYFVDSDEIIRGFAISVEPTRNLYRNLQQGKNWAGFVNLDSSREKHNLFIYTYGEEKICRPYEIKLPKYKRFIKKLKD